MYDYKKKYGIMKIGLDTDGKVWVFQYHWRRHTKCQHSWMTLMKQVGYGFKEIFSLDGRPFENNHDDAVFQLITMSAPGQVTEEQVRDCIANYEVPE